MKKSLLLAASFFLLPAFTWGALPAEHFAGAFARPQAQASVPVPVPAAPDISTPGAAYAGAVTSLLNWGIAAIAQHDQEILSIYGSQQADEATLAALLKANTTLTAQLAAFESGPIHMECADAIALGSGYIQPSTSPETGQNCKTLFSGQAFFFEKFSVAGGAYQLVVRGASGNAAGGSGHLELARGTSAAAFTIPATGSYQTFANVTANATVTLKPGLNQLIFVVDTASWNPKWFELTKQ